jgi:hypothetical protein
MKNMVYVIGMKLPAPGDEVSYHNPSEAGLADDDLGNTHTPVERIFRSIRQNLQNIHTRPFDPHLYSRPHARHST